MSERLKGLFKRRPEMQILLPENRWPEFQTMLFEYKWNASNIQRVKEGYVIAQGAFIGQPRKSGQDWMFSHGERIAKKVVMEWVYRDPAVVIAALNHDTFEDTLTFEPPRNIAHESATISETFSGRLWLSNSEKREFAKRRMTKHFGKDTAKIILALSKPEIDNIEIFTPEQVLRTYLRQLIEADDMRVLIIKLEDRINNLEEPFDKEQHEKKKEETRVFFLPIFERLLTAKYKIEVKLEVAEKRIVRLHELL